MSYWKSFETKLIDDFGFKGQFTPIRDFKVTEPYRVAGTTFGASIDTDFWTAATSGAGSASGVANAIATLSSGTANSGYGILSSIRPARFMFAHPLMWRGAFRVTDTTVALNTRRWGAFSVSTVTPQNGVFFEVDEDGTFSVNHVSNTSITKVESGSFNGNVDSYTMDTNVHAYEIVYFTMGAWFYVDNVLIHTFLPTTSVLYESLNVPINTTSVNTAAGVTSGTIECFNTTLLRLGRDVTEPISNYQSGTTAGLVLKTGAGKVHGLQLSGIGNNSAMTLYDNTAASGTILWASGAMPNNATPFGLNFGKGIPFYTGLTLVIATANSTVITIYE